MIWKLWRILKFDIMFFLFFRLHSSSDSKHNSMSNNGFHYFWVIVPQITQKCCESRKNGTNDKMNERGKKKKLLEKHNRQTGKCSLESLSWVKWHELFDDKERRKTSDLYDNATRKQISHTEISCLYNERKKTKWNTREKGGKSKKMKKSGGGGGQSE